MKSAQRVVMSLAALTLPPAHSFADSVLEVPTVIFVGVPETADTLTTERATCSTTAIPPQEIDVFAPTFVTARAELNCGESRFSSTVTAQFRYFGDAAAPVGSGTLIGEPTIVQGPAPLTAESKIGKLSARPGWYTTYGTSRVTYTYRLDQRRDPPQGCSYLSDYTVSCTVQSSPVHVETASWIQQFITRGG